MGRFLVVHGGEAGLPGIPTRVSMVGVGGFAVAQVNIIVFCTVLTSATKRHRARPSKLRHFSETIYEVVGWTKTLEYCPFLQATGHPPLCP